MLRRATTGRRLHRQYLSQRLQNTTARCPFSSTPLSLSDEREELSRLGNNNPQNPPSSSSSSLSSIPKVEKNDDGFPEGEVQNSTIRAMFNAVENARALEKDPKAPVVPARTRTRMRPLRPVLIPPSFKPSLIIPATSISDSSSSSDQNTVSYSSTTTISVVGMHPQTTKADIRPVFQPFGEITRIVLEPDRSLADIIFADIHGVKRTLHAYAEKPLRVKGREIFVFRRYSEMRKEPSVPSLPTPGRDDGTIFVANFPPSSTEEELSKALEPFGKVEQIMMRMSFSLLLSLSQTSGPSERTCYIIGPGSKYAYLVYPNKDHVERTLKDHHHNPIILQGRSLRIELAKNNPYSLTPGFSGDDLRLAEQIDPVTRGGIIKQLTRTVPKFRGSHDPSRVLWVGRLPVAITPTALTNFWSRLGCVVEVRLSA